MAARVEIFVRGSARLFEEFKGVDEAKNIVYSLNFHIGGLCVVYLFIN